MTDATNNTGGPAGSLGPADYASLGKSLLIATFGIVSAWLTSAVIPKLDENNSGGMIAVGMFSVLAVALKKFTFDTSAQSS
ncbi:MAG: hypothetical protein JWM11_6514 [Planctomycetaceae bacterium]|nr:hypothetical protein [Planctomycetaceae bacterium]